MVKWSQQIFSHDWKFARHLQHLSFVSTRNCRYVAFGTRNPYIRPNSRYMFTRSRDSSKVEHSVLHKSRVLFIKLTNNFYTRETFNPLLPLPVLLVIIIGKDVWYLYTGSYFYETLCTSFGHNLSPDNGMKLTGQINHAFVFNKHGCDCAPFSIGLHWINNQKNID